MKRHHLVLILIAFLLALAPLRAAADEFDMLPSELQDVLRNLMATRWPPNLKSLTLSPERPAAEQPVLLTAEIHNPSDVTDDETNDVKIIYSTDAGKTWAAVGMEQQDNRKFWTGEIPGQPSGTEVLYGLSAVDTSGNIYIEAVCKMNDSPFADENYIAEDCVHKNDPELCAERLPRGCMFPLAVDDQPLDDEKTLMPDEYDFWDYRIGYNDEYIFMDLAAQGAVSQGSASPLSINLILGGVLNYDRPAVGTGLQQIINQGAALVYAPLLSLTGGVAKPCSYLYKKADDAVQDEQSIRCIKNDNHLLYQIKRSAVGDNPGKILEFLAIDGVATNISPVEGKLYEYSHFTNVRFESRTYTVE